MDKARKGTTTRPSRPADECRQARPGQHARQAGAASSLQEREGDDPPANRQGINADWTKQICRRPEGTEVASKLDGTHIRRLLAAKRTGSRAGTRTGRPVQSWLRCSATMKQGFQAGADRGRRGPQNNKAQPETGRRASRPRTDSPRSGSEEGADANASPEGRRPKREGYDYAGDPEELRRGFATGRTSATAKEPETRPELRHASKTKRRRRPRGSRSLLPAMSAGGRRQARSAQPTS